MSTQTNQIIDFVRHRGLISPSDVESEGLNPRLLGRLVEHGTLQRITRGVYAMSDHTATRHHDLAVVAKLVPDGVFCLLTSLRFHQLTTQDPHRLWLAIPSRGWKPEPVDFRLRIVRMSEQTLGWGVENHRVEGVAVRIFNPAKTIADCFRFRRIVGLDVAIEALRQYRQENRGSLDDVWRASEVTGVCNVIRPYIEMVI